MKVIASIILFFGIFVSFNCVAQDVHFTQFYASPLSQNPANTGNYQGDWRVMNNFRRQWKSITTPFVTTSLAYDQQFYYLNERFSGGIILINDKSGDSKLTANKFLLSGAYHKKIVDNDFHFGFQAGIVNKTFDLMKLTFPDQYDHSIGGFNNQQSTSASVVGDQLTYTDLNFGISWNKKIGKFEPEIGLAVFHLNKPSESFFDKNIKLQSRKVVSLGGRIELTSNMSLYPNLLFMRHTKASDMLYGFNIGHKIPVNNYKITSLFGGFLLRNTSLVLNSNTSVIPDAGANIDASAIVAGINFNRLTLGVSYDYTLSELKSIQNIQGALEFSLIYKGLSTIIDKIAIPCDRY